jgi:hypothetical protein
MMSMTSPEDFMAGTDPLGGDLVTADTVTITVQVPTSSMTRQAEVGT